MESTAETLEQMAQATQVAVRTAEQLQAALRRFRMRVATMEPVGRDFAWRMTWASWLRTGTERDLLILQRLASGDEAAMEREGERAWLRL